MDKGDYEEAILAYKTALEIYSKTEDRYGIAQTFNNIGLTYFRMNDYDKAIQYYKSAIEISKEIGTARSELIQLYNLGLAYLKLNKSEKSLLFFNKALRLAEVIRDDVLTISLKNRINSIEGLPFNSIN